MDSWLATLRREIRSLGGKKKLSETGKPDAENEPDEVEVKPRRRTLVVRDPDRFSRTSHDFALMQDELPGEASGVETADPASQPASDFAPDDVSVRNSVISADGQLLDSLRNSNHRLSFMSSEQRTVITSSDSSPACSPTRQNSSTSKVRQNLDSHAKRTSLLPKQLSNDTTPRKYSSTSDLGDYQEQPPQSQVENDTTIVPQAASQPHIEPDNTFDAPEDIPRAASSMEEYMRPHKPLTSSNSKSRNKRASFGADQPSFQYSLNSYSGSVLWNTPLIEEPVVRGPQGNLAESAASSTKAVQVPSGQRLAVGARTRTLSTSRSMPILEGPPPLPPPNRALPAIPKKQGPENPATTALNDINV
ncbi:hypothetical protein DL769_004214 [Monosporascus sp. CRB-8-3]|nr:hypothetical protein DL769_004214 [Monosporascus sp. CRB-8-3]